MIGKLDQRIVLQSLAETNSFGQLTQAWTTVATVYGNVIQPKGSESFEAARINATETIRVKIRYRTDVTNKWRFQWESQNYSIQAIDRAERREGYMWLTGKVTGAL